MEEDLLLRFIGLDLLSNVANDIGYAVNRLAGRINALSGVSAAQDAAMTRANTTMATQFATNEANRAYATYQAEGAILSAKQKSLDAQMGAAQGNAKLMNELSNAQMGLNVQKIANEGQYASAYEQYTMQRTRATQIEERERIASHQRMMAAITDAGSLMVMTGAVMVGAAAAIGGGLLLAADHAAKFEQQLLLIQTQAGASAADVNLMRQATLDLAPQFGFTAQAAAQAAFHIESVGIHGKAAVDALRAALEGARVGAANLEDVTNLLAVVMASGVVKGAQSAQQAMATLNAIIGQGNIRMDDLSASFRTGLIGAMQMAGVGLTDTGAALATLTDLGYTGASAGTALRSALTMIAAPSNVAAKLLKDLGFSVEDVSDAQTKMQAALLRSGINVTQFADVVRKDGIDAGLQMLHDKMVEGGLTADQMAATITKAFGGSRIGSAFKVLFENLDRLKLRENGIAAAGTPDKFAAAWAATSDLLTTRLAQLGSTLNNIAILIGEAITPAMDSWMGKIQEFLSPVLNWIDSNKQLIAQFAPFLVAVLAIGGAVLILVGGLAILGTMIAAIGSGLAAFSPPVLIVIGLFGALGGLFASMSAIAIGAWDKLQSYWNERVVPAGKRIWDIVQDIGTVIQMAATTVMPMIQSAWEQFGNTLTEQGGLWDNATQAFQNFSTDLLKFIKSDAFAALVADLSVTLPAAFKVALDGALLFGDSLQIALVTAITLAKVAADEFSGNYKQAAIDAAIGATQLQAVTNRFGADFQQSAKDQAAMFDGTNQAMWQQVYLQTLNWTSKLGDDGSMNMTKATNKFTDVWQKSIHRMGGNMMTDGQTLGNDFGTGLANGIIASSGLVNNSAQNLVYQARKAAQLAARSASPSQLFAELGETFPQGTALGIDRGVSQVEHSVTAMVASGQQAFASVPAASAAGGGGTLVSLLQEIRDGILLMTRNTDPTNQPRTDKGDLPATPANKATDSTVASALYSLVEKMENDRRRGVKAYGV